MMSVPSELEPRLKRPAFTLELDFLQIFIVDHGV